MNSDPCNRNTEIINACILVNLCNNDVWIWYNFVQSTHVAMIQIYEMTVSSEIANSCISRIWIRNNSIMCNSDICTWNNSVQCNKYLQEILSSVLECPCSHDTCTCNNGVHNHDNSCSYSV